MGLSGEIRAVSMCERRVIEAQKLGFTKAMVPRANHRSLKDISGIELIEVSTLDDVITVIL